MCRVQISFQTFWFLTEGISKNFSNFPTVTAYGQVLYSHRNWCNRKGINAEKKRTTNNSNFRWWRMHHDRLLWWARSYRMSMVIMRAVRFKCIYNTISDSREPEVCSKMDNEVVPSGALKPRRRWPLSPVVRPGPWLCVSFPGRWTVRVVLSRTQVNLRLSAWATLLDDGAQRWLGGSVCQYPWLSSQLKNYWSYRSVPALQALRYVTKVYFPFGADDNHFWILSCGLWIFSSLEFCSSCKWNLFYKLLSGRCFNRFLI